jgi:predicted RNase H-like nuclease (RuvC/YqgF family)
MIDLSKEFHPYPKNRDIKKDKSEAETKKKEVKKKTETKSKTKKKTTKKQTKIKQKSKKLAKKEKNRISILQDKNNKCFLCGKYIKTDTHEIFGGSNRKKSMEHGLIVYLCRECHKKADTDEKIKKDLHNIGKAKFIKEHSKEEFLKEFGKNYL